MLPCSLHAIRTWVRYTYGKASNLRGRIGTHATDPTSRLRFWNYFSAFVVDNTHMMSQLEAVLIAAMHPPENHTNPRLPKLKTPRSVRRLLSQTHAPLGG